MESYSKAAMERAMKVQEVMLRAWAKKITWWQAAEILGISDRHLRRIREGYEKFGYSLCWMVGAANPRPSECRWQPWRRCWPCMGRSISI